MVDRKFIELRAVVANLAPATARATLARGTLDTLGLPEVPVAAGSSLAAESHSDTFTDKIAQMAGQNYLLREAEVDGQALLLRVYEDAEPASLTLLLSKGHRARACAPFRGLMRLGGRCLCHAFLLCDRCACHGSLVDDRCRSLCT